MARSSVASRYKSVAVETGIDPGFAEKFESILGSRRFFLHDADLITEVRAGNGAICFSIIRFNTRWRNEGADAQGYPAAINR